MATITPVDQTAPSGVSVYLWETLTEADTCASVDCNGTSFIAGSVQVVGTFGGATVVLQGSNDGTNWVSLKDVSGNAISIASAGAAEFSTAMLYIRPSASGGTSQDLDIYVSLRG